MLALLGLLEAPEVPESLALVNIPESLDPGTSFELNVPLMIELVSCSTLAVGGKDTPIPPVMLGALLLEAIVKAGALRLNVVDVIVDMIE